MSRPHFQLTDDQARILVSRMHDINSRYAGIRDNREFVMDFLEAVHQATGHTYSPDIYRRLLQTYAPDRRPSTTTLAQAKKAFEEYRKDQALLAHEAGAFPEAGLADMVNRAVFQVLSKRVAESGVAGHDSVAVAVAQRDFLQSRLATTESQLGEVRTHAARLAADLQAANATREILAAEAVTARELAAGLAKQIERLVAELEGQRRFALKAVDDVRGETRAWQERCAAQTTEIEQLKRQMEYFRRAAYQRGAGIPTDLREDDSKGAH